MLRRDFLKLGGLLSAAFFVQFNPLGQAMSLPAEAESQGKLYRGAADGKIYISANAGNSWELHTNFGPEFSILHLATDLWGGVHAQLEFAGHRFELALPQNGKNWRTD